MTKMDCALPDISKTLSKTVDEKKVHEGPGDDSEFRVVHY